MMNVERFAEALRDHCSMESVAKECQKYGMLCSRIDHDPDGGDTEFVYTHHGYKVRISKSYGRVTTIVWN